MELHEGAGLALLDEKQEGGGAVHEPHRQNRKSLPECIVSVFLLLKPKRARIEEDLTKARKTPARRAAKLPPKGAARNATTKLPCQNQNRIAVSIPPSRAETSSNRIEALIGTRSD
jgi:hypothetical protein